MLEITIESHKLDINGVEQPTSETYELSLGRIFQGKDATINGHNAITLTGDGASQVIVAPDPNDPTIQRISIDAYTKAQTDQRIAEAKNNVYEEIEKKADYLYAVRYGNIDYQYARQWFASHRATADGACSVKSSGGLVGRNYDWLDDYQATFAVFTPRSEGRFAVMGNASYSGLTIQKVDGGQHSEDYKILPFFLQDGINEHGLFAEVNVAPRWGNDVVSPLISKKDSVCAIMLVRYILDHFQTVNEAVAYLRDYVEIYNPQGMIDLDYELHYYLEDATTKKVIEFVDGHIAVIDSDILTNFHLYGVSASGDVYTPKTVIQGFFPTSQGIEQYGTGLERYNLLRNAAAGNVEQLRMAMDSVKFSKAHTLTDNEWFSEFVGGDMDVDTPADDVDYIARLNEYKQKWAERSKDNPEVWITCHSVIYDLNKKEMLVRVQERNDEYKFGFQGEGIPDAPSDGKQYGRKDGKWAEIETSLFERGTGTNSIQQKGVNAAATGNNAVAMGINTKATGSYSTALGYYTTAFGDGSLAEGVETYANGVGAHAEGNHTATSKSYAHAEGSYTEAQGEHSHAEGYSTKALGNISHAEGNNTRAYDMGSHSEGKTTWAQGVYSHAEGYNTETGGDHPNGNEKSSGSDTGNGTYAHAEGDSTIAQGKGSHSEGVKTFASANYAHAEGNKTTAGATNSHAEGYETITNGPGSHAEGYNSETGGNYTTNTKTASTSGVEGSYAHAEGNATIARGVGSHAEGNKTLAIGNASHAEGMTTTASGGYGAHAEGYMAKAEGNASHAEGQNARAIGITAHAEGDNTIAKNRAEHAEGRYNKSNQASGVYGNSGNTQHSIGIGTSESDRKNAFEVMQNGDTYLIGIGDYDGMNADGSTSNPQTLQQVINAKQPVISDLATIRTNAATGAAIAPMVPSQASATNQLADKAFVNSTVQTGTANFRGNWATLAAVPADASLYPADYAGNHTPTVNDYMVVQSDEEHEGATWRYKYSGAWATDGKDGWQAEYEVNETPMTAAQLAAINSGITAAEVTRLAGLTDKVFVAEYGVTTHAEIYSAFKSGKLCITFRYGFTYVIAVVGETTNAIFVSHGNNGDEKVVYVTPTNSYGEISRKLETIDNRQTTIPDNPDDNHYPTSKAVYKKMHPAVQTSPTAIKPNVLAELGTLVENTTITLAAGETGKCNHYFFTFDTGATAPTITWPVEITSWQGGSAPTINASKHYEVSVLNGVAVIMEV